ncbi:HEAT repeat domain-containing protein [Methylobacterium nodulans]|uniref:DNA alkylation repair enzyme n=1 Tax=Methylobacterium nodulans (strain LMG 21967 / CNCM I-2342 / ORS 2060) TaxID=460265 RepID=B8IL94_METNO|nr:HEAT repeat domain-containing protein [Methylobacterium nodulans]ACL60093.1 conserved hypothetical protein [Methylobacterium nodulans ORS 2060]
MSPLPDRLAAIQAGLRETATLAEVLAVDCPALLRAVFPALASECRAEVEALSGSGILARMTAMGHLLLDRLGPAEIALLAAHPSDTVRGWACFMIGARDMPLPERLTAIRPLADDHHFGVREWAWLAVRPAIAADLDAAFAGLTGWTGDPSERIRRFACEATRPRGVWCRHLAALKADPQPGRALLDPLRADPSAYVQNSVGNWLNDAAKTRPDWVRGVIDDWLSGHPAPVTGRIARRALRSIDRITPAEKDPPSCTTC